jgi:uncharacterized protein YegP (UPF0339 family)
VLIIDQVFVKLLKIDKMAKFEVFTSEKNGKHYFNLKAGNGQTILTSQGYSTKSGCENGIKSVKSNAGNDDLFDRKEAKNGKFHFSLLAKNKQIIGSSQMYASKSGMENGIKSVAKNAPDAEVVAK